MNYYNMNLSADDMICDAARGVGATVGEMLDLLDWADYRRKYSRWTTSDILAAIARAKMNVHSFDQMMNRLTFAPRPIHEYYS